MNDKIKAGILLLAGACAIAVNVRPQAPSYVQAAPKSVTVTIPAQPRTYRIRKGDRLWFIAEYFYGDGHQWHKIADANGIRDPRRIYPGQVIIIPE